VVSGEDSGMINVRLIEYPGSTALANIGMAGFGVKSHFPTLFAEGLAVAWCAICEWKEGGCDIISY